MGRKLGRLCPFGEGELRPHLTQRGLGQDLPPYQVHVAPNYTAERAVSNWLVWSYWNGIVRPSAPYKRSPELRTFIYAMLSDVR